MFKTKIFRNKFVKIFSFGCAYGAGVSLSIIGLNRIYEKMNKKKEKKSLNNN